MTAALSLLAAWTTGYLLGRRAHRRARQTTDGRRRLRVGRTPIDQMAPATLDELLTELMPRALPPLAPATRPLRVVR